MLAVSWAGCPHTSQTRMTCSATMRSFQIDEQSMNLGDDTPEVHEARCPNRRKAQVPRQTVWRTAAKVALLRKQRSPRLPTHSDLSLARVGGRPYSSDGGKGAETKG